LEINFVTLKLMLIKKAVCKAANKSKNRNNSSKKDLIDLILFLKCSAFKFDLNVEKKFLKPRKNH
jgi:hypothetical protein